MILRDEKLAEIEVATVESAWRRPESLVLSRPGWHQITTPGASEYWLNGVLVSELGERDARDTIRQVAGAYRASGCGFRWWVGPRSKPANLSDLLVAEGIPLLSEVVGMAAEVGELELIVPPEVTVEQVTAPAQVDAYVQACVAGWGTPSGQAQTIRDDMLRALREDAGKRLYYLARFRGEPAASGVLMPFRRSGYLMGSSTDPRFRGKGVYRALVAKRVEELKRRGIPLVTIQALQGTSAPICAKLGFEELCRGRIHAWKPE